MIEIILNILQTLWDAFFPKKQKPLDPRFQPPIHWNCRCMAMPIIEEEIMVETGDGKTWPLKKSMCVVCFNRECSCKF